MVAGTATVMAQKQHRPVVIRNMLTMAIMMMTTRMITSTMKQRWISVVWSDQAIEAMGLVVNLL